MVLDITEYDAAYFGDVVASGGLRHVAGYSNYNEMFQKNWFTETKSPRSRFIDALHELGLKHGILNTQKTLELGGATGHFAKAALANGYDWNILDSSQYSYDNAVSQAVKDVFTLGDVRIILPTLADNQYSIIFSHTFLECLSDTEIIALIPHLNRVGTKQFHIITPDANPTYYNQHPMSWWSDPARGWKSGTVLIDNNSFKEEKLDNEIVIP